MAPTRISRRTVLAAASAAAAACTGVTTRDEDGGVTADDAGTTPDDAGTTPDAGVIGPAPGGKYRFQQPLLFQRAHVKSFPIEYTNASGAVVTVTGARYFLDGSTYAAHSFGASSSMLCTNSKWPWAHPGDGDWVDKNGTAQGTAAFVTSNAITASTTPGQVSLDVTDALRAINAVPQWCAFVVKVTGGTFVLTGVLNATPPLTAIDVTYEDGSTETLGLWFTGSINKSSSYTDAMNETIPLSSSRNGLLEFHRPADQTKAVRSATLRLDYSSVSSGGVKVALFVCSPPLPSLTPNVGLAAGPARDDGLTGHADVIVRQLITDTMTIEDVLDTANSGFPGQPWTPGHTPALTRGEAAFDPTLWGTPGTAPLEAVAAPTLAELEQKLPRRNFGKWVGSTSPDYFRVVRGDDALARSRGFTPLADGLGAIELTMPGRDIANGQCWYDSGEQGTDVDLWFDRANIGRVSDVYVRYYVMLASGWDAKDSDFRVHFTSAASNVGKFPEAFGGDPNTLPMRATDLTGKFFGGAQQVTAGTRVAHYNTPTRQKADGSPDDSQSTVSMDGGYGRTSGYTGFQGRGVFQQGLWKENFPGPSIGGATLGIELYDFAANGNAIPSQTSIGGWDADWRSSAAHFGGLGHLYPFKWYCFELHWKLNSLTPYVLPPRGTDYRESGFAVDGVLEFFVDGVLAGRTPPFATRRLPMIDWALQASSGAPFDTNLVAPHRLRPITNVEESAYMGFASVAGNLYYGGRSPNPRTKHVYVNGLVAAKKYIGPMAGVSRENGGLG